MPYKRIYVKAKAKAKAKRKPARKSSGLTGYHKSIYGTVGVKAAKKRVADAERAYKKKVREAKAKAKKRR